MALTLFAVNEGYFDDIEVEKALDAERAMRDFAKAEHADLVDTIEKDKKYDKDIEAKLHELLKNFKQKGSY